MNKPTGISRRIVTRLAVFVAVIASVITAGFFLSSGTSAAQETCTYSGGVTDCNGWEFEWFLASGSVSPTGLTLRNIEFNGDSVMFQANFAGLPVKYDDDACGPYVDLFSTITNSQPTGVQANTFTVDGEDWLEMGAHYQIGQYVLYTAFYFGETGEMEMRIFARGLQCNVHHEHYPIFVMDVDLEGQTTTSQSGNQIHGPGDEVYYNLNGAWTQQTQESDNLASQMGHEWIVRDPDSAMTVAISHDAGTFAPPSGNTFAAQGGFNNTIYTRQSGPLRELAWPGAPTNGGSSFLGASGYNNGQWSYNNGETLADPVIAVRTILDHAVGSNLPDDWHTSGIRLSIIDDPLTVTPPTATPTATATSTPTATPTSTPTPTPTIVVPPQGCVLADGVAQTGLAGAQGDSIMCTVVVPAGASQLEVVMTGNGDADLYTRAGSAPTTNSWDCRPYTDGSSAETCSIANPAAGTHYVMVRGWAAFSNVSLTATISNVEPTGCNLANGVASAPFAGPKDTIFRCEVEVPAGATNLVIESAGAGDADLYVKAGTPPSLTSYDCRPYTDGSSTEQCPVGTVQPGTYHVMINGWAAFSNVTLTASWDTGGGSGPDGLTSGVPVTGLSGAAGSDQYFTVNVPAGTATLTVELAGGSGDADLYTRFGADPTQSTWACRPYIDGSNDETCTITNPTPGTHHIMVNGWAAYSGVSLTATVG